MASVSAFWERHPGSSILAKPMADHMRIGSESMNGEITSAEDVAEGHRGYRDLLSSPGATRVVVAQILGPTADGMWSLGIILIALTIFHSPLLAGAVALCNQTGVFFAPVAGALVDRFGCKRLIVIDYAVTAGLLTTIAALLGEGKLGIPAFLALTTAGALTSQLSAVALRTIFPQMFGGELLDRANALTFTTRSAARTVAPAITGALIAYASAPIAVASTAALYLISATVVVGYRDATIQPLGEAAHVGREIVEGLRYSWVNPVVRRVGIFTAVAFFGWGAVFGAVPVFIQSTLHGGAMLTGIVFAVFGIVGVATGPLSGRLNTGGREGRMLFVCAMIAGLSLLALGIAASVTVMFLAIVALGLVETPVDQTAYSVRQRYCAPEMENRVRAVGMAIDYFACGIGIFASAALAGRNAPATLIAFGCWVLGASLLGPWACSAAARNRVDRLGITDTPAAADLISSEAR